MLNLYFFLTFVVNKVAAGPNADRRSTALPVTWRNFVMQYFFYTILIKTLEILVRSLICGFDLLPIDIFIL